MGTRATEEREAPLMNYTKDSPLVTQKAKFLLKNFLRTYRPIRALRSLEKHQRAFEDLKQAVIDEPVLDLPDHTEPFEIHRMHQTTSYAVCYYNKVNQQHKRLKISMRPKAGESDFIWLCY